MNGRERGGERGREGGGERGGRKRGRERVIIFSSHNTVIETGIGYVPVPS